MLRQEQRSEEYATPAAQVRVTPQELVEAISAVESRLDAAQRHHAETVALGEAVEQLGLPATAEELLAEIEQRRRQRQSESQAEVAASATVTRTRERRRTRLAGPILACSLAVNVGLLVWLGFSVQPSQMTPASVVPPAAQKAARLPELKQLSSVPENTVVHADYATLQDLARGKNPSQVKVDVRPEQLDENGISDLANLWSLVKKDGHLYVRAWTTAEKSLALANGHGASVSNHTYDKAAVPVDVGIERLKDATVDTYLADGGSNIPIGINLQNAPLNTNTSPSGR